MDVLIKTLLGTTLIPAILFVFRSFTSNNFDKLFMLKYQKSLHNTFMSVFLFIIFIAYGIFFAAIFAKIKDYPVMNSLIPLLLIVFSICLLITVSLCLSKRIKDKKLKNSFLFSRKWANALLFLTLSLNIFIFSIALYEIYAIEDTTKMYRPVWWGNLAYCIIFFFALFYVLIKSNLYLQGISKREWGYVLSPIPSGIEEKHLYVLYSLNSTTLVLSDDPTNKEYPRSVYLFDTSKKSYICFNRVLNLKNSG
ncbi:hypothetical protein [Paenibacillus sp. YYML68]|uniref:hypothetical protein n=1 Tax=Paenibacillus sp. YYML68 TaxID=2909250 RepID=UPI002490891F|nr:hypothetical protein [Paenibacillus sp. YYML68]